MKTLKNILKIAVVMFTLTGIVYLINKINNPWIIIPIGATIWLCLVIGFANYMTFGDWNKNLWSDD